jgi:glycerol-3-phosphate dehydrogenase
MRIMANRGRGAREAQFDVAVVGGGINGAGIARDAAGRGLRVLLVEQNDLASGTSSASTKLIHGGLRYLEHGWFRLVRAALSERELMLRMAPHLIRPMRFVLPVENGMRPYWMLRLGLILYDHLGGREILPPTRSMELRHDGLGAPLRQSSGRAFEYSDCCADDARLVVLNAVDAAERGAVIRPYTKCMAAERTDIWRLALETQRRRENVTAGTLVNATGPWLALFAANVLRAPLRLPVRLDKGSHIVARRLFNHDRGYVFQTRDARVVFALPFERDFTLIGTTDSGFAGDPAEVRAGEEEVAYLCDVANQHFRCAVTPAQAIWSFAGVRLLHGDASRRAQDISRDYALELDQPAGAAPLLNVYGGKITTYRRLAEDAVTRLARTLKSGPPWTASSHLPGGDFPHDGFEALLANTRRAWPFLGAEHARRLVRAYGTRVERVLGRAQSLQDLGPCLGTDLTGAELEYLIDCEWARTADDVLWRRSKLGLRFSSEQRHGLAQLMAARTGFLG